MEDSGLLGSIRFLQSMVAFDIKREGETASFMVRSGLLRDILEVAAEAIEAQRAATPQSDAAEDESAVANGDAPKGGSL